MNDLEKLVVEILRSGSRTFDELREELWNRSIYVDGLVLRKVVAELVRRRVVCKEPCPERRRFLLRLC